MDTKTTTCNILVSRPHLASQPCGRAVIIINAQRLLFIMLYMTLLANKENLLSIKNSLNTQQDITATSSVA